MDLTGWLRFGHILSAIVWLGGGLALSVIGSQARARNDPATIREFGRTLGYVGPRVLTPGVLGTIVFGVALVLASNAWDFGQGWILLALALFVVAFAIGVGYLGRIGLQLGRLDVSSASGEAAQDLVGRWIIGYRAVLIVLVVIVWDMVFKPGL